GRNRILGFLCALLGWIAYHITCESIHGSTLGKLVCSLAVVQEDGSPCRFKAFTRSFAYQVDALFFTLIGYTAMRGNAQQQRHGDRWGHTVGARRSSLADESPWPRAIRTGSVSRSLSERGDRYDWFARCNSPRPYICNRLDDLQQYAD